ncbi:MAG: hypothetical protein WBV55_18150 [Candidatus Sulfotelmatobacter sp.]
MQSHEDALRYLKAKRQTIMEKLEVFEEDLEHLNATIHFLEKESVADRLLTPDVKAEFPIGQLRNLTQVQAVVAIAKHNGGIVKAQDAKHLMIQAGVMRNTKNSTNIAHNVILRSGKFERIAPGEFRLKDAKPSAKEDGLFQAHAPVQ